MLAKVGRNLAHIGHMLANDCPTLVNCWRCGRNWAKSPRQEQLFSAMVRQRLGKKNCSEGAEQLPRHPGFGPKSANTCQTRGEHWAVVGGSCPNCGQFQPTLAGICQISADLTQISSVLVETRAESAQFRPSVCQIDQVFADVGQILLNLAQDWTNSAQMGASVAPNRPILATNFSAGNCGGRRDRQGKTFGSAWRARFPGRVANAALQLSGSCVICAIIGRSKASPITTSDLGFGPHPEAWARIPKRGRPKLGRNSPHKARILPGFCPSVGATSGSPKHNLGYVGFVTSSSSSPA